MWEESVKDVWSTETVYSFFHLLLSFLRVAELSLSSCVSLRVSDAIRAAESHTE